MIKHANWIATKANMIITIIVPLVTKDVLLVVEEIAINAYLAITIKNFQRITIAYALTVPTQTPTTI